MTKGIFVDLGIMDYKEALELQEITRNLRIEGKIPDVVFFVEHPPVLTIGRNGKRENILVSDDVLESENIKVYNITRGGDVTYHGPGQLVGYIIANMLDLKIDLKQLVWKIQKLIIDSLDTWGIKAGPLEGYPGVWVGNEKICALGISIRKWVTMHGFALNIDPIWKHYMYLIPCGISDKGVTSVYNLGGKPNLKEVKDTVLKNMILQFGFDFKHMSVEGFKEMINSGD